MRFRKSVASGEDAANDKQPANESTDFSFDLLDELHENPLKIVVVGHTNHGKTSTIRTLCEDAAFGKVKDEPGTTTGIHRKRNQINGKTTFLVYDTPGFEDLNELYADVEATLDGDRTPRIDDILQYLRKHSKKETELIFRTLEVIIESHVIIYVINVTEPVLDDYKGEIECLKKSGVPLVVAFNFSKTRNSQNETWVRYLKHDVNIHTYSEYDAHTRTWQDEDRLFEKMKILVGDGSLHQKFMDSWIRFRRRKAIDAIDASVDEICEMVNELAACVIITKDVTKKNKDEKRRQAEEELQDEVNKRKMKCIEEIATSFGFSLDDISNDSPSKTESESILTFNVFDSNRLRWSATIAGLIAGGASGGVIDACVGGTSFGLGLIIGGLFGAALGYFGAAAYEYKYDDGTSTIKVALTTPVILLLIGLGVSTARALKVRGRANPNEVHLAFDQKAFKPTKELLEYVKKSWTSDAAKQKLREEVQQAIRKDESVKGYEEDKSAQAVLTN